MYTYGAYGLSIHSDLPLPELQPLAGVDPDVVVRIEKLKDHPLVDEEDAVFCRSDRDVYLFWSQVGKFRVQDGREITVDPLPQIEEQIIRLPLLGKVLATLLHQRGLLVLHASAIAIGEHSVAFIGDKGAGKSTMAATLYARGHHLMADDIVALVKDPSGTLRVLPGFPQLKLWPEAILSIGENPDSLLPIHSQVEKRARSAVDRFSQKPMELRRVYCLSRGLSLKLEPIQFQAALVKVIGNFYLAQFGEQFLQGSAASRHLHQCADLVKQVPVSRLERPRSLELLPEIAHKVEQELMYEQPVNYC